MIVKKEIGQCKNCIFYNREDFFRMCACEEYKYGYDHSKKLKPYQVKVEDDENWGFNPGPEFGCIHWKNKDVSKDKKFTYAIKHKGNFLGLDSKSWEDDIDGYTSYFLTEMGGCSIWITNDLKIAEKVCNNLEKHYEYPKTHPRNSFTKDCKVVQVIIPT